MKIVIYCQHVLGVGHFFRTLEIVNALSAHEVILVTGGGAVEADIPTHVRRVRLPGLMMDADFGSLHSVDQEKTVEAVKKEREILLLELFEQEQPDLFMVELYPFGRRAFRFELVPVLQRIRDARGQNCRVICSLRDILVEKSDTAKYEGRVITALNKWFDAVLIHSDPQLIPLDETFERLDQIRVPLVYTGFVTPLPEPEKVNAIRQASGVGQGGRLIVASAGGGNVGARLLRAVVEAYRHMDPGKEDRLQVYTGPYMDEADIDYLSEFEAPGLRVKRFAADFVSCLAAADLSISMAGYNTCMNIVAAGTPSLVWPFARNREQRARAERLERFTEMKILEDADLDAGILANLIHARVDKKTASAETGCSLNIQGARHTARWVAGCKTQVFRPERGEE